ncbi:hypothetical protein TNIN_270421 [Trichonephila inaurata madagascariensis]|uniref:Uncharacterized protein n=1 Tax=Trichonephila inaurata madagascariensis TaxID=2747483 RepID=A0A8X6XBU0_9ARAC|nr:hypothetical protein TNIN_270421 [Trichonephila inaurata madagascariensis]
MRGLKTYLLREARPTFPGCPWIGVCVRNQPHAHPRSSVRSLSVQVKAPKGRAKVLERTSDEQKGKNDTFSTCIVPREIRGSDEGSEGRICCAEARPTFPDVRGQVEDIYFGK